MSDAQLGISKFWSDFQGKSGQQVQEPNNNCTDLNFYFKTTQVTPCPLPALMIHNATDLLIFHVHHCHVCVVHVKSKMAAIMK